MKKWMKIVLIMIVASAIAAGAIVFVLNNVPPNADIFGMHIMDDGTLEWDDTECLVYWCKIPIITSGVVRVPVPNECAYTTSDGVCSWEFGDNYKVTVYDSTVSTGLELISGHVYTDYTGTVGYKTEEKMVVIETTEDYVETITAAWGAADPCVEFIWDEWPSKNKLKTLPESKDLEVVTSPKGVDLPGKVSALGTNLYTAELWRDSEGTDYMAAFVLYDKIDAVKRYVYGYCSFLPDQTMLWYEDDNIVLGCTDNTVVGARKITENKYILYVSSRNELDYVLHNLRMSYSLD